MKRSRRRTLRSVRELIITTILAVASAAVVGGRPCAESGEEIAKGRAGCARYLDPKGWHRWQASSNDTNQWLENSERQLLGLLLLSRKYSLGLLT